MSTTTRLLAVTVSGVLTATSVQASPPPAIALTDRSDRILVYSRAKGAVDRGRLERSLTRVERLLGEKLAHPLRYYHYEHAQEVAFATGRYADGVTFGATGEVHAIARVSEHEIVHAVACRLGNPGNFFHEGLAVALADGARWRGRDVHRTAKALARRAPLSALIAGFDSAAPGEGYAVAGSFVSWLIKTYGLEKVTEFFRACPDGTAGPAFARTFGQSLDQVGLAWAASL